MPASTSQLAGEPAAARRTTLALVPSRLPWPLVAEPFSVWCRSMPGCEFQLHYAPGKIMRLRARRQHDCEHWVQALRPYASGKPPPSTPLLDGDDGALPAGWKAFTCAPGAAATHLRLVQPVRPWISPKKLRARVQACVCCRSAKGRVFYHNKATGEKSWQASDQRPLCTQLQLASRHDCQTAYSRALPTAPGGPVHVQQPDQRPVRRRLSAPLKDDQPGPSHHQRGAAGKRFSYASDTHVV